MLSSFQKGTVLLIKSAITKAKNVLPTDFDLSLYLDFYNKCHITPLIYYGALSCDIPKNSPAMTKMFNDVYIHILLDESQNHEIQKICKIFSENQIDYMPLKGAILKKIYPQSHMRTMSDFDVLIKCDQYSRIKPLMIQLGFSEHIESDHEYVWASPNLTVELHKLLIPSYNIDYYSYYSNGWEKAKRKSPNDFCFHFSKEDFLIYDFVHFAKHYRDGGIGIKHMVDLWVYKKANADIDDMYVSNELSKLGLSEFYSNICSTLNVWFEECESSDKTDFITNIIFSSGAYGKLSSNILARAIKTSKTSGSIKTEKKEQLSNLLFPKFKVMEKKYPILTRLPVLLPLLWGYRLLSSAFTKNSKSKKLLLSINNINDKNTKEYYESLKYVGLDFNFKK